jgi:hypothetical protein
VSRYAGSLVVLRYVSSFSGVALCGFVEGVALCGFVGRVLAVCRFVGWVSLLLMGTYGRLRGVGEGL